MVIALLTDFGSKDYFVGAVKGKILTINPSAKIVDITHEIAPQDLTEASFTLCACYKNFPKKTIFVAVVDPGVGSSRKAILVETANYFFIAPDNGLLSFVFDEEKNFKAFELTNKRFFAKEISQTFHGRDIFASVAAHLSKGIQPKEFGAETEDFIWLKSVKPQKLSEEKIEGEILHIDRFGNLITNLKQEHLSKKFNLEISGKIINQLSSYYAEAEQSELFMITGSAGFLEIVAFQDSAKEILKVKVGEKILLKAN